MIRLLNMLILFIIWHENLNAQDLITIESCQTESRYFVIQKSDLELNTSATISINNYQVILIDTVPSIDWWKPTIEIKEFGQIIKKPNPTRRYTRTKKYEVQRLVKIINNSGDSLEIEKPDGCLMLGLQAKNENGEWVDVEEMYKGACGNSFIHAHNDILRKSSEWLTFTELFSGKTKTRYRIKFLLTRNSEFIYSNEIDGTIDECRFIRSNHSIVKKTKVK